MIRSITGATWCSALALASGTLLSTSAAAQDNATAAEAPDAGADASAADSAGNAIVVTGIRAGLDRAISVKRRADSVVDVISAEDVGRFPDVNVAESVQRITGVQINRTRGEGRTVNIRGLPANFTLGTFNGRLLPNALSNADTASSRTFDFTILPPEFIRLLSVYKSPTADLEEGGLSGTVDVTTPRPFDTGRRVLSASAQGEYESNSGKFAPRASAFYSDVFADGRIGFSAGISYTRRKPETHTAGAFYTTLTEGGGIPAGAGRGPDDLNGDGVIDPNLRVRIPLQTYVYNYEEDNERISAISSLQFKASDALTLSLDGFYSKLNVTAITNENLQIFNNASTVISAQAQDIDGLPTTTRLRVADLDNRGGGRYERRKGYIYSLVGGAEYEADGWTAKLDASYARSAQHRDNLNIATIANGEAEYIALPDDKVGSTIYYNGFDTARLDPASFRVASLNGEFNRDSSDEVWDVRADVAREFGTRGLTAIRFGGHYVDRAIHQDNERLTVSAAGVSALFGGLPAGPIAGSFSAAPFMKLREAGSGQFLGSYNGSAIFPTSWLASDTRAFVSQFSDEELIAAGVITNDASGITNVAEQTWAGYARGDLAFGRLSGNIGLRVVRTNQQTTGVSPDLNGITVLPDAGGITRVPAAEPLTVSRGYTDFLPSLNLKFEASDDVQLRLSASRTMSRPNLGDISPNTTASGTALTVTRNNPYLDPFRANNLDLTAEWYFSRDGLLGAAAFYKDIGSLIRTDTTVETLPVTYIRSDGSQQQASLDFAVSRLVNGSGVNVKGVEVYYQQAFRSLPEPFDGLGTVLNYTFIDNSDPTQLTAASKHNFNATGYYEKGPVGVRLSYSWRSGFLSSVAAAPAMNQYTRAFGTLDGSINIRFTNGVSLVFEALNILDTDESVQYEGGLPASYIDAGRRVFAGVRFAL